MIMKFINGEKGQALTEYALTLVLVSLAALVFFKSIERAYKSAFDKLIDTVLLFCIKPL